jgi:hypothetical protein|tara:strand:- start:951 stop:1136 length:186 start_codon:yes stop_codon:yes gene_type:complete
MTDKDLEAIQTVDVDITAESIDAHVICLRDNGYKVLKKSSVYTHYLLSFLLGGFAIATIIQ